MYITFQATPRFLQSVYKMPLSSGRCATNYMLLADRTDQVVEACGGLTRGDRFQARHCGVGLACSMCDLAYDMN